MENVHFYFPLFDHFYIDIYIPLITIVKFHDMYIHNHFVYKDLFIKSLILKKRTTCSRSIKKYGK